MSTIIEFFVAPDDEVAAGVVQGGPGEDLKPVTYGNFDVWTSMVEWESILLDKDLDEVLETGGPDSVGHDGGALVFLLPPDVTKALAEADAGTLGTMAERWAALRTKEGQDIDIELAREMVGEMASLAVDAEASKGAIYCWVC